ncbi:MAG: hypothetical protein LBW77_01895 [Verrucomicrobiota bacterium]|jgi:Spy/CpxP family protein refolding chaperone|nr:hypothetical protein [Verrucomicrobiota bacterium]
MRTQRIAIILAAAVAVAGSVRAQQPENNADAKNDRQEQPGNRWNRGGVGGGGGAFNFGNWVGRRLLSDEFVKQVGIDDERAAKLKEALGKIDAQSREVEGKIEKAAAQQGEVAKKVLEEPNAKTDELMAIIEDIGKLRTEQAKLSTQMLVVIRDTLTPEQRAKSRELITAEGQRRMRERGAGGPPPGIPGREGGHERGNRPPPAPGGAPAGGPARPPAPQGW